LRIFEVDHPATQAWKRQRLAHGAVAEPPNLAFVPVDFDAHQPSFFFCLGVVPYLTAEAAFATLGFIGALSGGAQVVFDYSDPPDTLAPDIRDLHDAAAARIAGIGEAWISYFEREALAAKLRALGFTEVEDLGPAEIVARFFPQRAAAAQSRGGHIVRAATF
jgi:methyltransferase (TIGR00027 family)